jgi:hypothetical protein
VSISVDREFRASGRIDARGIGPYFTSVIVRDVATPPAVSR